MPDLRSSDFFRLNQALEVLHAEVEPTTLFDRLSRATMLAIDAETVCFDGYDPAGRIGHLGAYPDHLFTPDLFPVLSACLPEHPLFTELMQRRHPAPLRTSDRCRMPQFFRTRLYNDFYRPFALTHQLVLGLDVADHGWVTCALARHRRDFSATDCTVLHLLKPHFQAAVRHARTVLHLRQPPPVTAAPASASFGLTPREAIILGHLTQGLTDKEISRQCAISPRTVQNHLQKIYAKLEVDSRTAALCRVLGQAS